MSVAVSIIVPALNEGACIQHHLQPLQVLRSDSVELILVDGGSTDDTRAKAQPLVDQVLLSPPGRARQMNLGASAASAEQLCFLHADTLLPPGAIDAISCALERRLWGRFNIRLLGQSKWLPIVSWFMNRRSCLTAIATGDQAIFVRRSAFDKVGGFADIELMEDVAISRSLKELGAPACVASQVHSSGRRWDRNGPLRTIWLMWRLRFAYFFGADPAELANQYRQCNSPTDAS